MLRLGRLRAWLGRLRAKAAPELYGKIVQLPSPPEPSPDMFELVRAVREWHQSRTFCKDWVGQSTTAEQREKRQGQWDRWSRAEAALDAVARKLGKP